MSARGLLLLCVLAAGPAFGAAPSRCEPTPACALQLARDAAFHESSTARDDPSLSNSLMVLHWVVDQDRVTDPATLRPQFAALRAGVERWPEPGKSMHRGSLALAMASAGLVPEAQGVLGKDLLSMQQAMVYTAAASHHARRGQLREAFAIAKAATDPLVVDAIRGGIVESVVLTGKPELVREAGRLVGFDPELISGKIAMAHQAAGQHEAARAAALGIKDPMTRESTLGLLALNYGQRGPKSEVVPAMRLLLKEMGDASASPFMTSGLIRETALKILSERYTEEGDFAAVLALIPKMEARKRASAMTAVATRLRSAADIQNATLESEGLLRMDRELVADALNISRVRIGTMKAGAAMKRSSRPRATSNFLIELARELGPTQPDKAREILQAAVAPDPRIGDPDWSVVIAAQLDLGLFAEAARTMDAHQRTPAERMVSQLRFSQAHAKRGQKALAEQFKAQALTNFHATGQLAKDPAALATHWLDLDSFADAERELRSLMSRKVPADALRAVADALIRKRVELGEMSQAMDLATAWSAYQGGRSKPFLDVYHQATGILTPQ